MRQFFSWRVWAAFGALLGLVVALRILLPAWASDDEAPVATQHHVDFMAVIYAIVPGTLFSITDGVVTGSADFIIDGQRTMHITQGTLGDINCAKIDSVGGCVVVADLLGDAVVWFSVIDAKPALKADAAPIVELLDDNEALLATGWIVELATSVDIRCEQEVGSLSDFVRQFGPGSTTVLDVAKQRATAVRCSPAVGAASG